jgi:tetratricopeptide (TPR) repeat protein
MAEPQAGSPKSADQFATELRALRNAGRIEDLGLLLAEALERFPLRKDFNALAANLPGLRGDMAASAAEWAERGARLSLPHWRFHRARHAVAAGEVEWAAGNPLVDAEDTFFLRDALPLLDRPDQRPLAAAIAAYAAERAPAWTAEQALAFLRGAERFLRDAPAGLGDAPEVVAPIRAVVRALAGRPELAEAPEGLGLLLAALWPEPGPAALGAALPQAIAAAFTGPVAARMLDADGARMLALRLAEGGLPLPAGAPLPPSLAALVGENPLPFLQRLRAAGAEAALASLISARPMPPATWPILGEIARTTAEPALVEACLLTLEKPLGPFTALALRLGVEARLGGTTPADGVRGVIRRAGGLTLLEAGTLPDPWARRAAAEEAGEGDLPRATALGEALADTLDHAGLLALTGRMVAARPHDPRTGTAVARLLRRAWLWPEWFAACRRLETVAPRSAPGLLECAIAAIEARHFAGARSLVDRARSLGAGVAALRAEARLLHAEGRVDEALAAWTEVCARPDVGPGDRHDRIVWLFGTGRNEEAEAATREAMALHPADPRFPLKLAQVTERRGDHAAAAHLWGALAARPDAPPDARAGLLRCLWMAGETRALAAAIEAYRRLDAPTDLLPGLLGAWLAGQAGGTAALAQEVGALHRRARAWLAEERAGWRADPSRILLEGRAVSHPSPEHAAAIRGADALLDRFEAAPPVVVGNSPGLVGRGLGARIDAAGSVIRLNDARLGGFAADVGTRTTLWFSSANRLAEPDPGLLPEHSWLYQPEAQHMPPVTLFCAGRLGIPAPPRATFLPPALHRFGNEAIYPKPTTGFRMVVTLAMLLEAPVAITGFDFFQNTVMHYFTTGQSLQVGEVHAIAFERRIVEEILAPAARVIPW